MVPPPVPAFRLLLPTLAVLGAANVLNNRVARRLAPLTSTIATGAIVVLARRRGLSWRETGFGDGSRGVRIGGTLAAAVAAVYAGGVLLPPTRRFFLDERALRLSRARLLEEVLLQVPLGTVLLEEVAFRGVLPAALRRSYGPTVAVAASSALFGLWHVLPSLDMAATNPALSTLAEGGQATPPTGGGPVPAPHGADPAAPAAGGDPQVIPPYDGAGFAGQGPADSAPEVNREASAERRGPADMSGHAPAGGVVRLVAGSVVFTAAAGAFFCELRRRGGLLAPSLLHLATNSFGYLAARAARRLDRRR
jgi:membrane protease YdiL (CAAX protease family)